MSIFLNVRRIGKDKHKFKARITFLKLTNEATEKGVCFKVKIQRGEHQVQAISQPSRKGVAKFTNAQYVIPMTLFCCDDEKQNKYLEKQGIIKVYESNEKGEEKRKIGTKTLDFAEYANKGILKMQVQIDPSKNLDNPMLTIQLFIERQSDDSKSVDTYSNNNDIRENDFQIDKKIKDNKPTKNNQISSVNRKEASPANQFKKQTNKQKLSNHDAQDQSKKPKKRGKTPSAAKIYQQQQKRKYQDQYSQGNISRNQKYDINVIPNQKSLGQGKRRVNQQSQPSQMSNKKKQIQTQFNDGQSPQMQAFLLKKAFKQKQSEANSLKRQNQTLKKTIQKLIQQSSTAKEAQKRSGFQKQMQQIKKTMVTKQLAIDSLTTANKTLKAREQQYQKTIMKLRQQLLSTKQKISDIKYRQAFLMQELFESGNKEALQEASRFLSI